jgi:hypothetical protein
MCGCDGHKHGETSRPCDCCNKKTPDLDPLEGIAKSGDVVGGYGAQY